MHPAPPVATLAVAMVESAFRALLVPAIGTTFLMNTHLIAADTAAIALAAVATAAEKEQRAAFAVETEPLPQYHFAGSRHAYAQAATGQRLSLRGRLEPFG